LKILALVLLAGVAAHTAQAQNSYLFASPNTRASLTDEDAQVSLTSSEELNAIAIADRIACSMTRKVEISGVLGIYDRSSENSFLVESDLKPEQTEYLGSLLGKYERQKFVLVFFPQAGGHDRLWTIKTSKSAGDAAAAAREMHLTPVTERASANRTEVWVVEMGDTFAQQPQHLAANLGGTATSQDGAADLVGNDDRAQAAAIFDAQIAAFERNEKRQLSSRLRTKSWHDASTRTCSTEVPN
jgi:hypothetical protein